MLSLEETGQEQKNRLSRNVSQEVTKNHAGSQGKLAELAKYLPGQPAQLGSRECHSPA